MKKIILFSVLAISCANLCYAQAGNVGIGTALPGSKLTVNGSFAGPYKVVTTSATVGANDFYISYNGSSNGTLTLPAATAASPAAGNILGRTYHFKNTSTAMLTLAASGSELIDNQSGAGVASVSINPGYYALLISKGTTGAVTTWELVLVASVTADLTNDAFINNSANTRVELGTNADAATARVAGTEFVIKDDGKTGIGNTDPTAYMDINNGSDANTGLRIRNMASSESRSDATVNYDRSNAPVYIDANGRLFKRYYPPTGGVGGTSLNFDDYYTATTTAKTLAAINNGSVFRFDILTSFQFGLAGTGAVLYAEIVYSQDAGFIVGLYGSKGGGSSNNKLTPVVSTINRTGDKLVLDLVNGSDLVLDASTGTEIKYYIQNPGATSCGFNVYNSFRTR